jgi:hypothetical protein
VIVPHRLVSLLEDRPKILRSWRAAYLAVALCVPFFVAPSPAHAQSLEEVDLELVLMVDASGSVDAQEYALQRVGYFQAFRDPRVVDAIRSGYLRKIAVAYIEWTGPFLQVPIADWTVLSEADSVEAFAARLQSAPRILYGGGTSVGGAIQYGADSIDANRFTAQRKVIDVSGDGSNTSGPLARSARDRAVARGFTINGLPILTDEPSLDRYFQDEVIGGPGAFMIPAKTFEDFAKAIRTKLIREIAGVDDETDVQTAQRRH